MALVRLHATVRQGTMETFVKRKIVWLLIQIIYLTECIVF